MTLKRKRANKAETTNERRAFSDMIGLSNGYKRAWLLVGLANARVKKLFRFDVTLRHDWLIEQCLLLVRVLFGGKTKRPCFDLFIHWLIKLLTTTLTETIFQGHTKFALLRTFRCSIYIRSCRSTAPIFPVTNYVWYNQFSVALILHSIESIFLHMFIF